MIYLDTSVLVPLHVPEKTTDAVRDWYARLGTTPLATSTWSITEFASALAAKRRRGELTSREVGKAWKDFTTLCDADLHVLELDRATFIAGADFVRMKDSDLAAGDAIHLAAARHAGAHSLATFDRVMQRSALKLAIQLATIPGT